MNYPNVPLPPRWERRGEGAHPSRWRLSGGLLTLALALSACGGAATAPGAAPSAASPAAAKPASPSPASSAAAKPAASTPAASAAAKPVASASAAAKPAASGPGDKVSIAYIPTTAEGGLFIAAGKGYLRQNGIDGQLIKAASGPDVLPQVGTGQVDVAGIGITAGVFSSIARGVDLRIVADLAAYPKTGNPLPFLVRKALYDSGQVKSAKDVKGHKVALNAPGGINEYEWVKLLAKYNLTLNDVQTTFMGIPDEIVAFKNSAIDAAIVAEPNASQAIKNGDAVMVPEDSNPIPGAQGTYLVFSSKLIQQRPDVAKRFLKGYVQAMRDLNAHPDSDENVKVQAGILGFSDAIIRQQLGASVFPPDAKVDMASLADEEKVFMDRGELKELTAPLPADKLVNPTFLDAALKELGPA